MPLPFLLLAASATSPITCAPSKAADELVSRTSVKWLLLGETRHGTNEMPIAATDIICAAASAHRPVTVGIEFDFRNQPSLDEFMESDGGATSFAALLSAPAWDPEWADGKSSRAMLRLLDWLRKQHKRGAVAKLIAFDPDMAKDGTDREQQMARRLKQAAPSGRGILIALTGGYHARKRVLDEDTTPYPPMGSMLPRRQTVSIRMVGFGGRSWSCTENGCGEQEAYQNGAAQRQLSLRRTPDGSYDGQYDLGVRVTPSPPAGTKKTTR
jgi:hypothetical protein